MTNRGPAGLPVAVVTGATGGMGQHIVADLAQTHLVYALGRSEEKLAQLATQHPNLVPVALDLTAFAQQPQLPAALAALTEIDVLVHAAAVSHHEPLAAVSSSRWHDDFRLNVFAPALLTSLLLPALRKGQADIIFINSGAGRGKHPGLAVYAASKHALYGLADALRGEEVATGIRVTTIAPGPTDTPMLQALRQPYRKEEYIDPREIARVVRTVVASDPSVQLTEILVRPRGEG